MIYSRFIYGLKQAGIEMDRKVLSAIAFDDPASFAEIVAQRAGGAGRRTRGASRGCAGAGRRRRLTARAA